MAIYHYHTSPIGRSGGRSAVQLAAYVSGEKLVEKVLIDKEKGLEEGSASELINYKTYGRDNPEDVAYSKIHAPENAPDWVYNRELLWNKIQNEFSRRRDSVYCHHVDLSLMKEFNLDQNRELLVEFVEKVLVSEGMVVDVNIHMDNPENPHAHLLLSTRELGEVKGDISFGNVNRNWHRRDWLKSVRASWAVYANKHLERHGFLDRVSHLSHEERGLALEPGVKEGVARYVRYADRRSLNESIERGNYEAIGKNPELVIEHIARSKPVFTRQDIEGRLFEVFTALERRDSAGDNAGEDSEGNGGRRENATFSGSSRDTDSGKLSKWDIEFLSALEKVYGSEELSKLDALDFKGNGLYTTKKRYELEKDFVSKAEALSVMDSGEYDRESKEDKDSDNKSKGQGVTIDDLGKRGLGEELLDKVGLGGRRIDLSESQKAAVLGMLNGGRVSVVEGLPGSGKTAAMGEAVRQWKRKGYNVIATAVSNSACLELANSTGVEAINLTKLRKEIDRREGNDFSLNLRMDYYKEDSKVKVGVEGSKDSGSLGSMLEGVKSLVRGGISLTERHVLIVDESSMVDLVDAHYLVSKAEKYGFKLVFLGDQNQLPSVGIAGAVKKLGDIFGVTKLGEIRRQESKVHREAIKLLSEFDVSKAVSNLGGDGVFKFGSNGLASKDSLVKDYVKEYISYQNEISSSESSNVVKFEDQVKHIVALSFTNADVLDMNLSIRARLKDAGILGARDKEFVIDRGGRDERIDLSKGDRIVFNKNSKYLGVNNSDIGEVVGFGHNKGGKEVILAKLGSDGILDKLVDSVTGGKNDYSRIVEIDPSKYNRFDYGFAVNAYKAQGKTFEKVYSLIDKHVGFSAFFVMASRHASSLKMYVSEELCKERLENKVGMDSSAQMKLSSKNKENILYEGLVKHISRDVNNNLALSIEDSYMTKEWWSVKSYIESREEVRQLIVKNKEFVSSEARLGRYHDFWSTDYANKIKESLSVRFSEASKIYNNYSEHRDILSAVGINHSTLADHAKESVFKYSVDRVKEKGVEAIEARLGVVGKDRVSEIVSLRKDYLKTNNRESNIDLGHKKEIRDNLLDVTRVIVNDYRDLNERISIKELELITAKEEKYKADQVLEDGKEFKENYLLNYIGRTFRESPKDVVGSWSKLVDVKVRELLAETKKENSIERPVFASTKYHNNSLIEEFQLREKAIDKVNESIKKDPSLVGTLRGRGIGFIPLSGDRIEAKEKLGGLGDQFVKLNKYEKLEKELEENIAKGKYENEIVTKELELKSLAEKTPEDKVIDLVYGINRAAKESLHIKSEETLGEKLDEFGKYLEAYNVKEILDELSGQIVSNKSIESNNLNKSDKSKERVANKDFTLGREEKRYLNQTEYQRENNRREYIRDREKLLAEYESSRLNDDRTRFYRSIAGAVQPDLAYDIIRYTSFAGHEGGKAKFVMLSEFDESKKESIESKLLEHAQSKLHHEIAEVELKSQIDWQKDKELKNMSVVLDEIAESTDFSKQIGNHRLKSESREEIVDRALKYKDIALLLYPEKSESEVDVMVAERSHFIHNNLGGWLNHLDDGSAHNNRSISEAKIFQDAMTLANIEYNLVKGDMMYEDSRSLASKAIEIFESKDDMVGLELCNNESVKELSKEDELAAKYMAENIVGFKLEFGIDPSEDIIEKFEVVSHMQADLDRDLNHKLSTIDALMIEQKNISIDGESLNRNQSSAIVQDNIVKENDKLSELAEKDRSTVIEVATKDLASQVLESKNEICVIEYTKSLEKSDNNVLEKELCAIEKSIADKAIESFTSSQEQSKQESIQEIEHQIQIDLDRGMER